jgi:hypothetical protein
MLRREVWKKFAGVSEVLATSITRALRVAVSTSETSINFYQTTRCNIFILGAVRA